MQTIELLQRKIDSARNLQSVARTMKTLAAVNIRQYQEAVSALDGYGRTVELGLQVVLRNHPELLGTDGVEIGGRAGAVIFGSDRGMCGQFNERITTYAHERLDFSDSAEIYPVTLAVGIRAAARLEAAGIPVQEHFALPGSTTGITASVQEVLLRIEEWRARGQAERVYLIYNKPTSGASYEPYIVRLLPLDLAWLRRLRDRPWPHKVLPTFTMDLNALFRALVREHLFVSILRAFAGSLASENASRLSSMQAAEKNIEEHLEELQFLYHRRRQQSITEELMDVVTGFEAISGDQSWSGK